MNDRTPAPPPAHDCGLAVAGLARRRFLRIGGLTVATAALVAACGDDDEDNIPSAGLPTPTTGLPERTTDDIVLLRTSSSIEHSLVFAYDALLEVADSEVAEALTLFRQQHDDHALLMERLTTQAGGEAFTEPNPAFQTGIVVPTLDVITSDTDATKQAAQLLLFAHSLENIAAATYQSTVPIFTVAGLRESAMSVGTVEARHSAVFAGMMEGALPVAGLETLVVGPTTVPPSTTTTVPPDPVPGEATTTTSPALIPPPDGVFQVPGAFGSLAEALGPNSYVYDDRTIVTTATG